MAHIAIVGGGPAGYVAAIRARQLGAEVTLIEMDALGGTCTEPRVHPEQGDAALRGGGAGGAGDRPVRGERRVQGGGLGEGASAQGSGGGAAPQGRRVPDEGARHPRDPGEGAAGGAAGGGGGDGGEIRDGEGRPGATGGRLRPGATPAPRLRSAGGDEQRPDSEYREHPGEHRHHWRGSDRAGVRGRVQLDGLEGDDRRAAAEAGAAGGRGDSRRSWRGPSEGGGSIPS